MTIEEFEQASEIYRKYDEIEDIIERIKEAREEKLQIDAVSYTHLTLPTSADV